MFRKIYQRFTNNPIILFFAHFLIRGVNLKNCVKGINDCSKEICKSVEVFGEVTKCGILFEQPTVKSDKTESYLTF